MSYGRSIEKLSLATRHLASSPSLHQRLEMALVQMTLLQASDLPEGPARERWQAIMDRIGREPVTPEGQLSAALRGMSVDDAEKLACEVVDIMLLVWDIDARRA